MIVPNESIRERNGDQTEVRFLQDLFAGPPSAREVDPLMVQPTTTSQYGSPSSHSHEQRVPTGGATPESKEQWRIGLRSFFCDLAKPTTWIGGCLFVLYHVVFSLTMGAAVTRPHGVFGVVAKMSASGVMFASVVYWFTLGDDIPALYPAVDLFCAPFLANLAAVVDDTLERDGSIVDAGKRSSIFLATFSFLMCFGLVVTATLLMLASVFKLANLGAFLPSPVLSGFFSAVGVLLWMLAVKVDSGGIGIGTLLFSGDVNLLRFGLEHHVPSLILALAMKYLSPWSPFFVVGCIAATIASFYVYMTVAQVELQQMVEAGWFWEESDLLGPATNSVAWGPPAPAGWINSLCRGYVHWDAVSSGMSTVVALAFLYMIRCSLHGSALRKNIGIMERYEFSENSGERPKGPTKRRVSSLISFRQRQFSEAVDVQTLFPTLRDADDVVESDESQLSKKQVKIQSKPTHHSLTYILAQYAYSQYLCAFVGGCAMAPSIGPSSTMYALGAESLAPQLLSVVFLSIFFFTNFHLVVYIPKPAFSSVLILAFIDIIDGWFVKSYLKTRSKLEWLVNPFIVATAFSVGLLSSVFLGIAMSTFFFVGSFYTSGVVKYSADATTIRSSIERQVEVARWLDLHGALLRVMVLQSYLFFGNATSVLNCISAMFEDKESTDRRDGELQNQERTSPKFIVLDFALVPGMDGSAVDVIADIHSFCLNYDVRLFLSGMSPHIRKTLQLGGVKPDALTVPSAERRLRFFFDMDSAIGKAEDLLITQEYWPSHRSNRNERGKGEQSGFLRSLSLIDEEHHTDFRTDLAKLSAYTNFVELSAGEKLYDDIDSREKRGLFFIEEGTLRIERNSRHATGRSINRIESGDTRSSSSRMKNQPPAPGEQTFRLARIGPGWVLGDHEVLSGLVNTGQTIAVSSCRLHHVSYEVLDELENKNPALSLKLYKLLSKLHALRSEVTIGQLATLHNIMAASPHHRPLFHRNPSMS